MEVVLDFSKARMCCADFCDGIFCPREKIRSCTVDNRLHPSNRENIDFWYAEVEWLLADFSLSHYVRIKAKRCLCLSQKKAAVRLRYAPADIDCKRVFTVELARLKSRCALYNMYMSSFPFIVAIGRREIRDLLVCCPNIVPMPYTSILCCRI